MKRTILFLFILVVPNVAMSMADYERPVYGRPTLYGEYELTDADVSRARGMYGDASLRAAPIRAGGPTKNAAAKHPVKSKHVARAARKKTIKKQPKKPANTGKSTQQKNDTIIVPEKLMPIVDSTPMPRPESDANKTPMPKPVPAPVAAVHATNIAGQLQYKLDTDAYCTARGHAPRGTMPDGFILMQGRPDLMSCVEK